MNSPSVELQVTCPPVGRGPVTAGLPFPRGALSSASNLRLRDATGAAVRLQARDTDRWPDGSVRWVLLDWIAEAGKGPYRLEVGDSGALEGPTVEVREAGDAIEVNTGATRFKFERTEDIFPCRFPVPSSFVLEVERQGQPATTVVRHFSVQEHGALRTCICVTGASLLGEHEYDACIHFFAGSAVARVELTVRNPQRATHPGGLWDLGDPGSTLLGELSLSFAHSPNTRPADAGGSTSGVACSPEVGAPAETFTTPFELYQDSSGGENWRSTNHLTREHKVPVSFRGYRLKAGGAQRTGLRATPIVTLSNGEHAVGVAVPEFWQNFPMAIEATNDTLTLQLLPSQFADLHEIQGGEQKTWTFAVAFGPDATPEALEWFRTPARAVAPPEWYCASGAIPYLTPKAADPNADYLKLVDQAIEGPNRFDAKREVIDEYGWRNFGDIYGDHEAVYGTPERPVVSHYNNQYDPIAGFAYQFLRSGNSLWLRHMEELARHVIDIDIYHTQDDKSAYNGGLFWHTYHYADADTGTHRSYPRALLNMAHMPGLDPNSPQAKRSKGVYARGGGPGDEHNYTTGLMLHYFLTGSTQSREAAIGLARWVIDMDDGRKTVFRFLTTADTGLASQSRDSSYHGPGRGSGNSLAALLDGHRLTGDAAFLAKAEQLVRRCIHPADNVARRNLLDVENRWFYTIFLYALGKYLDYKAGRGELDRMYAYARASLLHYARWMAEHEVPTLSRPEILEYPNETWAAQDVRKSEVFKFAAKHTTGAEKAKFLERSEFFFRDSVARLTASETKHLARPVVLLLTFGQMHAYFQSHPNEQAPPPKDEVSDFGTPEVFVPQKVIAMKRAKLLAAAGAAAATLALAGLVAWLVWA